MRHPFDGIENSRRAARRTWLGALAGLAGLFFGSRAFAAAPPAARGPIVMDNTDPEPKPRRPVTKARGEDGKPTTEALREEAAMTQALNEGATTKALREEALTRALNENGGPQVTTLALGEEG